METVAGNFHRKQTKFFGKVFIMHLLVHKIAEELNFKREKIFLNNAAKHKFQFGISEERRNSIQRKN